jgi:hypothetical protein
VSDRNDQMRRQIEALGRDAPALAGVLQSVLTGRLRWVRVPLGLLFVLGGFLAILPVFGLWMIPVGLVLLALDIPQLQPAVVSMLIRGRRWWRTSVAPGGWLARLRRSGR